MSTAQVLPVENTHSVSPSFPHLTLSTKGDWFLTFLHSQLVETPQQIGCRRYYDTFRNLYKKLTCNLLLKHLHFLPVISGCLEYYEKE